MLNSLLAWTIALGSLALFSSGFLLPEVRRKNDLIWSGVGLLYALVLWADSDRIKGGLLLGQMASVALIVWLGWQTLQQRRQLAGPGNQTPIPDSVQGVVPFAKQGWERLLAHYQESGDSSMAADLSVKSDADGKTLKIGSFEIPLDFSKLLAGLSGTTTTPSASPSPVSSSTDDDEWEEDETGDNGAGTEPAVAESAPEPPSIPEPSQSEPVEPEPEAVHDQSQSPEPESSPVDEATVNESPIDTSTPEATGDVQSPEGSTEAPSVEAAPEEPSSMPEEAIAADIPTTETETESASEGTPEHMTEETPSDAETPTSSESNTEAESETVEDATETPEATASSEQTEQNSNEDEWPPPDPIT